MNKSKNILVVDDNHESLSFLCDILKIENYNTLPADSGELALASLETHTPDLILLDIRMPGIDGFEVCRKIKQTEKLKEIPVIFLTAASDVYDKVEGFRLGAADYITKPFQKEELLIRINTHLELYRYNRLFKEEAAEKLFAQEKKLKRSEHLLNQSEQLTKSGGWEYDTEKKEMYWTKNLYHIHGLPFNPKIDHIKESFKCYNPEYRDVVFQAFQRCVSEGAEYELEAKFTTAKKETIWIKTKGIPVYEGDKIVKVIGTVIDITNQKKTESVFTKNNQEIEVKKRIAEHFVQVKDEEIFSSVLNIILEHFKCNFGYLGYIDKNENLVCPSMTYDIMDICKIDQKTIIFPQDKWGGIWGESLKSKSTVYKDSELYVPNGHIPLKNALACVILNKDKLIGQIVLANKENGFQDTDVYFLEELCSYISPLLAALLNEFKYKEELLEAKNIAEENERNFSRIFNSSRDGYVICLGTGEFLSPNPAYYEMLGYSKEELSNVSWKSITPEKWLKWEMETHGTMLVERGYTDLYEKEYIRKDGTIFPVQVQAFLVNKPQKLEDALMGVFVRDITEQKKAERVIEEKRIGLIKAKEKAEETERQYRQLFENMEQGFALHKMIYDENDKPVDYRFVLLNNAFEKQTGKNASDFIMKTIKELLPDTEQTWIDKYGKVAKSGEPILFENYSQEFDKYYNVVAYSPQKDYFATIFTDVTKNKLYEKELEEHRNNLEQLVQVRTDELETSNEELRAINEELYEQQEELNTALSKLKKTQEQLIHSEKMASLGVLIAGVAHEINNPINFISGSIIGLRESYPYFKELINLYTRLRDNYEESVVDKIKDKEKTVSIEFLEEILNTSIKNISKGVERSTKIVKGLLSFTKADSKNKIKYDIHSNLDDTLTILYNQYKKRVQIIKNYGDLPKIICFSTQINQVWMNILINAIQSIKDTGTITISTNVVNNKKVSVSIKDTGIGMTDKVMARIYDPFFTTKPVGQGTGLGMSIVYNNIKNNKGEIKIESQPGIGTEFKIYLPINNEG